ncbi:PACE efflux transporter [Halodesulfovibrio spirochaetisodalis]|nr:PACE efflux transporter [Halodesulfovibrio spirochaetisodalis]
MNSEMRTTKDRLRHTVLFELLLLTICVPLMTYALGKPAKDVGLMSIFLSMTGATWNFCYNIIFDHVLIRLGVPLYPRNKPLRIIHSVLFELTLLTVTIPAVMFMLNYTFIEAFMVDISFVVLVPVYAFAFNLLYDRVFPPPVKEIS